MTTAVRWLPLGRRAARSRLAWLVIAWLVIAWLSSLAGASGQESAGQPDPPARKSASAKLTPESIEFRTQPVGTSTGSKTATLTNTGTAPLTITAIFTSGIDFQQTNSCGHSLPPGEACTIQITFKPATTGPRLATLQVLDSGPASPQSIALEGTGQ